MPPMPFPMPLLFITAVKDICAINTFEKLLNILFSEVYCWYFGFTTLLFSATITDMSLYEVLNLFPSWPHVFRSFLYSPLARDVLTPDCSDSKDGMWSVSTSRCRAHDHNLAAVALITFWCNMRVLPISYKHFTHVGVLQSRYKQCKVE